MVARIKTVAFEGIIVTPVEVQVQIAAGLPSFTIVGLPDKAVGESRERVRSALQALGLGVPAKRITVNLAPADLQKEGSHFDLPVALGLLVAMGVLPADALENMVALGELSLDARILPVAGVLPAAIAANAQGEGIICPEASGSEAVWAGAEMKIWAASSLMAIVNHIKGAQILPPPRQSIAENPSASVDLRDVKGLASARRALEVAAAGGHNLLMSGAPGTGKSMLAACLPGILPPMQAREILETSMISSIAGELTGNAMSSQRPFRTPHHSASMAAMVGGGKRARPGEISLAHHGVLFLDELPEFSRNVLESIRQPLETGNITVARANAHYTYPANFQLVAAMNPCRCGYLDDAARACSKAPRCAEDYSGKISGPIFDRIDIHIDVPLPEVNDMLAKAQGESSADVAARVQQARAIQSARYAQMKSPAHTNAHASGGWLEQHATPDEQGKKLLEQAVEKFRISMRGYTRILRVSRTLADLEGVEQVRKNHIAEALAYRRLEFGRANKV